MKPVVAIDYTFYYHANIRIYSKYIGYVIKTGHKGNRPIDQPLNKESDSGLIVCLSMPERKSSAYLYHRVEFEGRLFGRLKR